MKKTTLALLAVIVLVLGGILYFLPKHAAAPIPEASQATIRVTLSIEGELDRQTETVAARSTVLDLLAAANAADPALALSTKEYAGLGTLVTGMAGKENGTGGKYWQYKVNGVGPQMGAGQYALHEGDTVEWFFAASQE